ncbi:GIY-YIG nuclease family protein [Peptococcaceae bacterium 1198_IL3148]
MDRKKELKLQYKEMKPPMGVFIIRSNFSNKCYIEATQDLKSKINSTKFKLGAGNHPNKGLQKEWTEYSAENFTIEILENLEYDKKDETKTDYSEELALLQMIWEERLVKENMEFYKKKL